MKRAVLILSVNVLLLSVMMAQPAAKSKTTHKDIGIAVSARIQVPVGAFASTHIAGVCISISPAYLTTELLTKTKIAFTYSGGAAYYLGKKEIVSGYSYTYPGYYFIHAFAGPVLIPSNKLNVSLTAGPAVGLYNGNTEFNIGSRLELDYKLNNKIAVGPGILIMKEAGADPLWALSLTAQYSFKKKKTR